MSEYKKKKVQKVKPIKPKKSVVSSNYKISSFSDVDEEINVKSAKDARAERKFEKEKVKYLKKSKPEKRVVYSNKTAAELNRSSGMQIIKGTKSAKRTKKLISVLVSVIIIFSLIIIQLVSPTGISDLIKTSFLKLGGGNGYPKTVNGSSVNDVYTVDGGIAVLSDTYIEIYNTNGKEILSLQHGYSSPSASISDNRILLYDEYTTTISVYDFSGLLFKRDFEEQIITAKLGRNGSFSVITNPNDSASKLQVFNKQNKPLISWTSNKELISSTAISDNGKYVAVIAINAKNGNYVSTTYIFKTNKKLPENQLKTDGLVLSIDALGNNFVVTESDKAYTFDVKKNSTIDITKATPIQYKTSYPNGYGVITGADSNADESHIIVLNDYGNTLFDFDIVSNPEKTVFSNNYLAVSKGSDICIYNSDGKQIKTIDCGISANRFSIINNKIYVAINENVIEHRIESGAEDEHNS